MARLPLTLLILICAGAYAGAQSIAPNSFAASSNNETRLESQAVAALNRLDRQVFVYRSLGELNADSRLARVSLAAFEDDLREITDDVTALLKQMPQSKVRSALENALDSYRDGAFWWRRIDQPRVIHISALAESDPPRTPSEAAFLSTVPYTVAIHWRHAHDYLQKAQRMIGQ